VTFAAVVMNPVSAPVNRLKAAVTAAEETCGWEPSRWFTTTAADQGRSAAREAVEAEPDVIIVAGGDGTVRVAAEEIPPTGAPVALVPTGTGNLLARNLGLGLKDLDTAVAAAFTGTDRVIDAVSVELERQDGSVTHHTFLAMAGIGVDAAMATGSHARLKTLLGWMAYTPPIARSILVNRSFDLHHRVDWKHRRSAPAHTMIVGNCGVLTGDIVLLPNAVIDDGLLDVVVLRPGRLIGWAPIGVRLALNGMLYRRSLRRPQGVSDRLRHKVPSTLTTHYSQGTDYEARLDEPELIELDGDVVDHVVRARFEILPQRLRLRVPAAGPPA
jgi:diacylglycerol kinase family enzyme